MRKNKTLSVFIDESGDFGKYDEACRFYVVSMVLHNQENDISQLINRLDGHVEQIGFPKHNIHVGPLIRRDTDDYYAYSRDERRNLFNTLFHFARNCPVNFLTCIINKEPCDDQTKLVSKITKELKKCLVANEEHLKSFDRIIIYYDNGQQQLTNIVNAVFNTLFDTVEIRKVRPKDYKLFQVADLMCTVELINKKRINSGMSKSEITFFGDSRSFYKNIYKSLDKKRLIK